MSGCTFTASHSSCPERPVRLVNSEQTLTEAETASSLRGKTFAGI